MTKSKFSSWQSGSAALAAFGMIAGAATPIVISAPATAQQANFSDVSFSYWARPFIERLAAENVIAGFPDGTFKPDQPVTRAQFAAIVQKAFSQASTRTARSFPDVLAATGPMKLFATLMSAVFFQAIPTATFSPLRRFLGFKCWFPWRTDSTLAPVVLSTKRWISTEMRAKSLNMLKTKWPPQPSAIWLSATLIQTYLVLSR
ncbi:MAG: S-layer homology domain-containing protein [Leptolyngbyaceae cyanobacterium SM1_1_3]|nr:S-layer homology domain-containing protein [Leptolyngbyaceae cyanobacterium SM1_1_3]